MSGGRDLHSVQQARELIDQLRRENSYKREHISQCANDLIRYCQDYQRDDYLIAGFATDKLNPYRPKNNFQCQLL
uniref:G protein gamma domain-containing protein n=1 Tax=Panagrellus redivivus TaxID=6233 RepID=A0A7E4VPD9_PANRE